MNRKEFIKKSAIAGALGVVSPQLLKANAAHKEPIQNQQMAQVGFNHLPNKELKTMNTVIHRAETRGHAQHGWLDAHHTFSFANYHNPERMHFGVLRVLNDDRISPGKGFGMHPHDNMEIDSIPLAGGLEHKDSMGNTAVIRQGDVQVMSAGTGVYHSEYNKNQDQEVQLLQIWMFPKAKNVAPRYDQISIRDIEKKNAFYQVLSPNANDSGVWVHQDAWFSLGNFDAGTSDTYRIKKTGNGVYAFVLEGTVEINGETLNKRDGMGIWNTDAIRVDVAENARILLMDVPMTV